MENQNSQPKQVPAVVVPLPPKFDFAMIVVALMQAGHIILEFKDENGNVVQRAPLAKTIHNPETGDIQVRMPMGFAKNLMNSDYELQANCLRPAGTTDDSMDTLVISCVKKDPQRIITDFAMTPRQARQIDREALRFQRKLN